MKLNRFRPENLIPKEDLTTILVYSSIISKDETYDAERQIGGSEQEIIPTPIKGYVRPASPEGLIIRGIGIKAIGSVEIVVNKKYLELLKEASRIEINGIDYEVYKDATGNKSFIIERPHGLIKLFLTRR